MAEIAEEFDRGASLREAMKAAKKKAAEIKSVPVLEPAVIDIPSDSVPVEGKAESRDEYFGRAVALVHQVGNASIDLLQRRLGIGYQRASNIIDQMEVAGIVGPARGVEPREIVQKPGMSSAAPAAPDREPEKVQSDFTPLPKASPEPQPVEHASLVPLLSVRVIDVEPLRNRYLEAKKKLEDQTTVWNQLKGVIHPENKKIIEKELEEARQNYAKVLAEYKGAALPKLLEEQLAIADARLGQYAKKGRFNPGKWYDAYKGMSEKNLVTWFHLEDKIESQKIKRVLRMVNKRTLITTGLLVGGTALGGTWLGAGMLVTRRVLGGVGVGFGAYDSMETGRNWLERRKALKQDRETFDLATLQALEEALGNIQARAMLDGKTVADLEKDGLYRELMEAYGKFLNNPGLMGLLQHEQPQEAPQKGSVFGNINNPSVPTEPHSLEEVIAGRLKAMDTAEQKEIEQERRTRMAQGAVAAGVGAVVGSGLAASELGKMGKRLGKIWGWVKRLVGFKDVASPVSTVGTEAAHTALVSQEITPQTPKSFSVIEKGSHVPSSPVEHPQPAPEPSTVPSEVPVEQSTAPITETPVAPQAGEMPEVPVPAPKILESSVELPIGNRGIEGALLDLKSSDAAEYDKMIHWLRAQDIAAPQDMSDGGLVHRFVAGHAQGHDMDKVFGGSIAIKPNGEIILDPDHIAFTPTDHLAGSPEAPQTEAGMIDPDSPDYKAWEAYQHMQQPKFLGQELIEQENPAVATDHFAELKQNYIKVHGEHAYEELLKTGHTPGNPGGRLGLEMDAEDASLLLAKHQAEVAAAVPVQSPMSPHEATVTRPDAIPAEAVAPKQVPVEPTPQPTPKLPSAETMEPGASTEALLEKIDAIPKTSEALKVILGPDRYRELLESIDMPSDKLDKVANMTIRAFADESAGSRDFRNEYSHLMGFFNEIANTVKPNPLNDREYLKKTSIREFMVAFALRIKQQGS